MNQIFEMDETRLREMEDWALTERSALTESENVLLDAIAEACVAVRQAWQESEKHRSELEAWRDKAKMYREELRKDRVAMEGADVELAVGHRDSADKARLILGDRLRDHPDADSE